MSEAFKVFISPLPLWNVTDIAQEFKIHCLPTQAPHGIPIDNPFFLDGTGTAWERLEGVLAIYCEARRYSSL
jgi:hypothetical protein